MFTARRRFRRRRNQGSGLLALVIAASVIGVLLIGSPAGPFVSAAIIAVALGYGRSAVSRQLTHDREWHALDRLKLLSGIEFERHVAELYRRLGYRVELTRGSGDQGVDVIAQSTTERIGIQCKQWSAAVGNGGVQEAIAGRAFYGCSQAAVVCTSAFTAAAKELARRANVQLIDGSSYVAMINRFEPLARPVGVAIWIPRGRAALTQAVMVGVALVTLALHFSLEGAATGLQHSGEALTQPGLIAPRQFAHASEQSHLPAPATPTQLFSEAVSQYYTYVNRHRYREAYALLSPRFQSTRPYAKWASGYADTLVAVPTIAPGSDPESVSLVITARERTADGTGLQVTTYGGTMRGIETSDGSWLIDGGYLDMLRRRRS